MNVKTVGAQILVFAFFLWMAWALTLAPTSPSSVSCVNCNVIIIGVDTLRADRVHSFGYEKETTPHIDALGDTGFSFTNAVSASSWTVPSFMSILTGAYPSVHGLINKYVVYDPNNKEQQIISNLEKISPEIQTLAEALKKVGYATGGFTGDAGVGHAFGYAKGFDVYTDAKTFGDLEQSQTHALSWLDSLDKNQKFFMFFHGYDLHGQALLSQEEKIFVPKDYTGPYTGSPQEEAVLREQQLHVEGITLTEEDVAFWNGLYDSKIRSADEQVGVFLSELEKRELLDNTIIILVSDHGEEWYEHGGIDHGHTLYDELVHVPLIISAPSLTKGVATNAQVSTMDVAPTLFDLLNLTPGETFASQQQGESLLPYLSGRKDAGRDVFLETDYRDFTHKRGIRTADGYAYILTLESGVEELYELRTDPKQQKNIAATNKEKAKQLREKLRVHVEQTLGSSLTETPSGGCLPVYVGECQ